MFSLRFETVLPLTVGAENSTGTTGVRLPAGTVPNQDMRVISTTEQPGGTVTCTVTCTVTMKGLVRGPGQVLTIAKSSDATYPVTRITPVTVARP